MRIKHQPLVVTTDALGAGTVTSTYPINGLILEVRSNGTAWSGTADFTLTRNEIYGGTILAVSDAQEPWTYAPRFQAVTTAGAALTNSAVPVPNEGYVTLTLAEAGSVVAGTVYVIYDEQP